jgi:hypothetical protein
MWALTFEFCNRKAAYFIILGLKYIREKEICVLKLALFNTHDPQIRDLKML